MKWRTRENQDVLWKTPWNPSNQDFEADQSQEDLVLCWVPSVMGGGICLHACWICWWFWLRTLWVLLVLEFVLKVCFVICLDRWSLGVEVRCWDRDDDIEVEAMNKKEVCTCCLWCVLFVLFVCFWQKWKIRRDPGSNQGPYDLQSYALPTELSWLLIFTAHFGHIRVDSHTPCSYHSSLLWLTVVRSFHITSNNLLYHIIFINSIQ